MLARRTLRLAPLAAAVALATGAPAADAAITMPRLTMPTSFPKMTGMAYGTAAYPGLSACGNSASGGEGQGRTGGIDTIVCGYGLTYVGPQTAITNTIGPTIIAASFTGTVVTSAGNVAIGY